jgi:hypothetical protein
MHPFPSKTPTKKFKDLSLLPILEKDQVKSFQMSIQLETMKSTSNEQ